MIGENNSQKELFKLDFFFFLLSKIIRKKVTFRLALRFPLCNNMSLSGGEHPPNKNNQKGKT